jgi:hypothetical protein
MKKAILALLLVIGLGFMLYAVIHAMPSAKEVVAREIDRLEGACARNGQKSKECAYFNTLGRSR